MNQMSWVIAGAAIGVASLGLILFRPEQAAKRQISPHIERVDPQSRDENEEVSRLRLEVARLAAEVRTLARVNSEKSEDAVSEPEGEARTERQQPDSPSEVQEKRAAQIRKLEEVSNWLATETRDEAWAGTAEKHLDEVLRGDAFRKSQVLSSTCRSSLCRVEVRHDSAETRDNFELMRREIDGNFIMQHLEPEEAGVGDGTLRTLAFFVRPGHEEENPLYDMMHTTRP